MNKITFFGPEEATAVTLVGVLGINLARAQIDAAGITVLTFHMTGSWSMGSLPIQRITCDGPITIALRDDGRTFGPITNLEIDGNAMRSAEGLFASYNTFSKRWHFFGNLREARLSSAVVQGGATRSDGSR